MISWMDTYGRIYQTVYFISITLFFLNLHLHKKETVIKFKIRRSRNNNKSISFRNMEPSAQRTSNLKKKERKKKQSLELVGFGSQNWGRLADTFGWLFIMSLFGSV
jgi:hypothetical protein